MAFRLIDKTVDHTEPEPGAFTRALGREEGLERMRGGLRRHANARIADRERDIGPGGKPASARSGAIEGDISSLDFQPAAMQHRIARIDNEVEKRRLQLV